MGEKTNHNEPTLSYITHPYIHTHTCTRTNTCAHIHIHTCTRTYTHMHMHAHSHMHYAFPHPHTHTHTTASTGVPNRQSLRWKLFGRKMRDYRNKCITCDLVRV